MDRSWHTVSCLLVLLNFYFSQQNVEFSTEASVNVTLKLDLEDESDAMTMDLRRNHHRRVSKRNQTSTSRNNIGDVLTVANSGTKLRMMATPCTTPNNDSAFCMPLASCQTLWTQLENPAAHAFLRESKCGPKNENHTNPNVCCGKYGNYANHNEHSASEDPFPKRCGRQAIVIRGRILGGKEAKLGEFPWMARLFHKHPDTNAKTFGCGGSLITAKYVLTAGHCLESGNIPVLGPISEVQFGEHDTDREIDCNAKNTKCADKPQVIRVKKNLVHPDYISSSYNHHHDIGLIHLKKAVKFTDYVYPICLPQKIDFQPMEYWISGWGATKNAQISTVKMKLSLQLYPHSNCTELYKDINVVITNKQICAGGKKNKDSCTGDSGGPLMVYNDTLHWFAAGIVSYGKGCGSAGWPGVYTNVTSYYDWIESTILKRAKSKKSPQT